MAATVETQQSCDCLILLCCQSVIHCCCRVSLRLGRHPPYPIFVVFTPRWTAASMGAFLLHQMQSATQLHSPLLFAGANATLPIILQQPSYSSSLSSLSPPPHTLPMAGCCVLGGQGQTLLTSSMPLDGSVTIVTITPVVC